jgi:4'-phosphopantetheinyl transferase
MTVASGAVDVDIWSVPLDGSLPDGAWAVLSDAERERARRMRPPAWQRDFVLSHYATREILARYTATDPAALEFQCGAQGKPKALCKPKTQGKPKTLCKPKAAGPVEFSLSHTGGLALLAVSAAEVGVDVELTRHAPLAEGLMARCLTAVEQAAVGTVGNDTTAAFLRYWTAKESYLKGLGIGLAEPLGNVEVHWEGHAKARIARGGATDKRWALQALEVGPHHVAAVAVNTPWPGTTVPIRYRDFKSLC